MMEKYLFTIFAGAVSVFGALPVAYAVQLAGYRACGALKTNDKARVYVTKYYLILTIFCLILPILPHFLTALVLTFGEFFAACVLKNKAKFLSSFRFTKRGFRLIFVQTLLTAAEGILFLSACKEWYFAVGSVLPVLSVPTFFAALFVTAPFEAATKRRYVKKTAKKIKNSKVTVVGVTGSYAKSSVKNFLAEILSEKYKTYRTLGNFNTPMGLSLSVKNMPDDTEFFVVEMGARKVGDIEEMCRIAKPRHAIITGIAPQHLETFLSIENIISEKSTLAGKVGRGGTVVSRDVENFLTDADVLVFGKDFSLGDLFLSKDGTRFVLSALGKKLLLETPLLGRHNAENVALAAVMALRLGVEERQVASAVKKLKPLPHRLSVFEEGGITVIDDSYNANPKGVLAAAEVLKLFPGRKVVITPGMVELGEKEEEENRAYGKLLSTVSDLVILTGKTTSDYVEKGLLSANFKNYVRFGSLSEAEKRFSELIESGDVVLFANDLPDNFN